MTLPKLLALLFALMMLLVPVALADDGEDDEDGSKEEKTRDGDDGPRRHARDNKSHDDENETDDEDETDDGGHRKGRNETAIAERASFRENRSALLDSFIAALKDMQASWKENRTAVREECRADEFDRENATKEERLEHAQCIKSGYAEWRAERRADLKELRAQLRELFDGWHAGRGKHSDA